SLCLTIIAAWLAPRSRICACLDLLWRCSLSASLKTNHRAHSMVTLSSPRRLLLLRPLFLRRLPLHHLLRPFLPERGHRQIPSDQRFLGRGILDVFCAYPMVRFVPFGTAPTVCQRAH